MSNVYVMKSEIGTGGRIMKLEIQCVVVSIDPGFVVEGDTEEEIKEAVASMFYYGIPSMHTRTQGVLAGSASEDAPSIPAEEIEGEGNLDTWETMDRVIEEGEKHAESMRKQGSLFPGAAE